MNRVPPPLVAQRPICLPESRRTAGIIWSNGITCASTKQCSEAHSIRRKEESFQNKAKQMAKSCSGKLPEEALAKHSTVSCTISSLPPSCFRPWSACLSELPQAKPARMKRCSPARWKDTGWRMENFRTNSKRSSHDLFLSSRRTLSLASHTNIVSPRTVNSCSIPSAGTGQTTAACLAKFYSTTSLETGSGSIKPDMHSGDHKNRAVLIRSLATSPAPLYKYPAHGIYNDGSGCWFHSRAPAGNDECQSLPDYRSSSGCFA